MVRALSSHKNTGQNRAKIENIISSEWDAPAGVTLLLMPAY
jgi:hypothetical protein